MKTPQRCPECFSTIKKLWEITVMRCCHPWHTAPASRCNCDGRKGSAGCPCPVHEPYEYEPAAAPTGTGEGSEWLTTKISRESAAWAGEGLAEHFKAGTWENEFVSNLAKDTERAIAENAALRSQLVRYRSIGIVEIAVENQSIRDYVEHWEGRTLTAERDLATAQARIASAITFLRRANATSTQNELYDLVDEARQALAEPSGGTK